MMENRLVLISVLWFFISVFGLETSITPSLPAGCNECQNNIVAPAPIIIPIGAASYCGNDYGVTRVNESATYPQKFTLDVNACYNNGKWVATVNEVQSTIGIERSCPNNPATIVCVSNIAGMTNAQACAALANFPSPITQADLFTEIFELNCWCRDCVAAHEEAHLNTDWVQQSINPEIVKFVNYLKTNGVDIDCSDALTLKCASAISNATKATYDVEWQARITAAVATWKGQGEGVNGFNAEIACYQGIVAALIQRCNQP